MMTDNETDTISKDGIGSDCLGRTIFGGDKIQIEEEVFTVIWKEGGWVLESEKRNIPVFDGIDFSKFRIVGE